MCVWIPDGMSYSIEKLQTALSNWYKETKPCPQLHRCERDGEVYVWAKWAAEEAWKFFQSVDAEDVGKALIQFSEVGRF